MKKNIILGISVLLVLCGGVILYILLHPQEDTANSAKFENGEIEQVMQSKNEKLYQKVKDQLDKDYQFLYEKNEEFQRLHTDFQHHDFFHQTIYDDSPEFQATFLYLQESADTYDSLCYEVHSYLQEESIRERGEALHVGDEYEDLYKGYEEKNFAYLRESFRSELPNQIASLQTIFRFLKEHQTRWAVNEKGIIFDDAALYEEYQQLLSAFEKGEALYDEEI